MQGCIENVKNSVLHPNSYGIIKWFNGTGWEEIRFAFQKHYGGFHVLNWKKGKKKCRRPIQAYCMIHVRIPGNLDKYDGTGSRSEQIHQRRWADTMSDEE